MSDYKPMTNEEVESILPLPKPTEPMITITKVEWEYLIERNRILTKLEGGGVDNWQGYSYAMSLGEDEDGEE